jgi:hypothetical protein
VILTFSRFSTILLPSLDILIMAKPSAPKKDKVVKASKKPVSKAAKPAKSMAAGKTARNTPTKAQDGMFQFLCEQHTFGVTEVGKDQLASIVGYQNPRSEGFTKAIKALMNDGIICKGGEKDTFALTEAGIAKKPAEVRPTNISDLHDHYIEFLGKRIKAGKDKLRPLWNLLADRQAKGVKKLSEELGYKNPVSFSNTKIIATMKEMKLLEDAGKGMVKMTDKAFPANLVSAVI